MTQDIRPMGEIVNEILAEFPVETLATQGGTSPAAADASREFKAAVGGLIDTGDGYRADRAALRENAHRLPPDGLRVEEQRLRQQAEQKSALHSGDAARALARLETALTESALPRLDPAREQLARQELDAAFGSGNPESDALRVATSGSREAAAALFTSYGETKLKAAGVERPDRVLSEAKKSAAAAAIERGASVRERESAALLQKISQLGAARAHAIGILRGALYEDDTASARQRALQDRAVETRKR
jgi:hypothetical protein